jgi:hypothetical protein
MLYDIKFKWHHRPLAWEKKEQGYEVDYHAPSNTEVKNGWGYTPTPPCTFRACKGTTVPYITC